LVNDCKKCIHYSECLKSKDKPCRFYWEEKRYEMSKDTVDCNNCKHLNITEFEQELMKKKSKDVLTHCCDKHLKNLGHFGNHPKLIPCFWCNGKDFEQR